MAIPSSGTTPQSGLKQKSAQANPAPKASQAFQRATKVDPIHGQINILDIQAIPGLHTGRNLWWEELLLRRTELRQWERPSAADKFFRSLIGGNGQSLENPRLNGRILQRLNVTKANFEHVKALKLNPYNWPHRLGLIESIQTAEKEFPIEVYRETLLQALLPVSVGYFNALGWTVFLQAYQSYLVHLLRLIKKKKFLLEGTQSTTPTNLQEAELKQLTRNMKLAEACAQMTRRKEAQALQQIQPFYLDDIHLSSEASKKLRKDMEDLLTPLDADPRKLTTDFTKAIQAMVCIPLLHPLAYDMLQKVQKRHPQQLQYYIVQGRLHRQAMELLVMRHSEEEEGCLPLIKKELQACLEAYGKGSRFLKEGGLPSEILLLREYAAVTLYAFGLREKLNIPREVLAKLIAIGRKNIDHLRSTDPNDAKLKYQLADAAAELS